jgi:hypothetical protein
VEVIKFAELRPRHLIRSFGDFLAFHLGGALLGSEDGLLFLFARLAAIVEADFVPVGVRDDGEAQ